LLAKRLDRRMHEDAFHLPAGSRALDQLQMQRRPTGSTVNGSSASRLRSYLRALRRHNVVGHG
jgi:hypothetical protein